MAVLDIERCVKHLGGGFKYFLFSPLLEEMIKFINIIQMVMLRQPQHTFHNRFNTVNVMILVYILLYPWPSLLGKRAQGVFRSNF